MGDLVRCIFSFNFFGSGALYLRFETCEEGIIWHVFFYLRHKHKFLILSRLSDFMTCSERFNIFSKGFLSQLWNTVWFIINQTFIYTNYKQCYAEQCYVAARKRFYNLSKGLFISVSKHCRKMKFRTHIHQTLISKIFNIVMLE